MGKCRRLDILDMKDHQGVFDICHLIVRIGFISKGIFYMEFISILLLTTFLKK